MNKNEFHISMYIDMIDPFVVISDIRKKKNMTFENIRSEILTTLSKSYNVIEDKIQKNLIMITDKSAKFGSMIIDIYSNKLVCGDLPKVIETDNFENTVDAMTLFNGVTIKLYHYCNAWKISTTRYIDATNAKYKNIPISKAFFNYIKTNDCFVELNKIGDKTPHTVEIDNLDTKMTYIFSYYDPELTNVINHGPTKLCRFIGIFDNNKKTFIPQNAKFEFDRASVDLMEVGIISDNYIVYSSNYKKRNAILSNIPNESFCILKNIRDRKSIIEVLGPSYESKFDDIQNHIDKKFDQILTNYTNAYKLKSESVFARFEIICTRLHMCYLQKEKIDKELIKKIFYDYPVEVQAYITNINIS
jgi:hypothetical protein